MSRWRCTHGHKWEADTKAIGFHITPPADAVVGQIFGLPIGEERAYCGRCIREWMDAYWGQVRADD